MSDNNVVYAEAKSHRWAFKNFRLAWQEGTPNITFGVIKDRPLYIPLEEMHSFADALDEMIEKIESLK
jgi:hypothetical protein